MNKEQLITTTARAIDLPRSTVDRCLSGLVNTVKLALIDGDCAKVEGFGTFKTIDRQARVGINPRTIEPLEIPASKAVRFIASDTFTALVQDGAE